MIFNSIEYAIFLPIVFILYWTVFNKSLRLQNLFVVAASYFFYGCWDWRFLILIAATSFFSWLSGILIEKYRNRLSISKAISVANIVLNLTILGIFKYYDFFISSFARLFQIANTDNLLLRVILPVGISFYTFQALSYSIDVYRGKTRPNYDIIQFFAFVSFFPQLVAGPIERATNLLPQFERLKVFNYLQATTGLKLILWGLFKKIAVADQCAQYVDVIFSSYQIKSGSELLVAALFFTFQIYGDFSGYSDIAIGSAKLFGINLMKNFDVPYFSRDIAEFWRRWHISLTTWFRDYVYIPLGGSRCSKRHIIRNTFIIFLLSGLWHGANWTFVLWGAYHACLFLPLILLGRNRRYKVVVAADSHLPSINEFIRICLTFVLVVIGWVIFRSDSITMCIDYLVRLFSSNALLAPVLLLHSPSLRTCTLTICIMLTVEWIGRRSEYPFQLRMMKSPVSRYVCYLFLLLATIYFYNGSQSFIYFQF